MPRELRVRLAGRSVTPKIAWAHGKLNNHGRFSTGGEVTKELAEESLDVMPLWTLALCQMAQG